MPKYPSSGDRFFDPVTFELIVAVPFIKCESKPVTPENISVLVDALRFYAEPKNWVTAKWGDGVTSPHAIPMIPATEDCAEYCDCGDTARTALAQFQKDCDNA